MNTMQYTGFIKRFLPFAVTFAAGLFIASFFVTIGLPKFGSRHRERRYNEMRQLRIEVEQLKKEKCDLRRQLEEKKADFDFESSFDAPGSVELPVPPPVPVAPRAPHRNH